MAWDPAQYLKFAGPRLRPALDLLQRIDCEAPSRVYDLGAGAGNVTRLIAARWPEARIIGVDSSAEMLAKAAAENPGIEWQRADLATWRPQLPPDIIYSNAALHWIEDHAPVFTALFDSLAAGGTFAVQIPRNFGAPSHTSMGAAARQGPWRARLEPLLRPAPVAEPAFYFDLLAPHAARRQEVEIERGLGHRGRPQQRLQLGAPRAPARRLAHRGVRRRTEIARDLNGECATRGEAGEEGGEYRGVVLDPVQRGVRVNDIGRLLRTPCRKIGLLPLDAGVFGRRLGQHLARGIAPDHARLGPARGDQSGHIAGT